MKDLASLKKLLAKSSTRERKKITKRLAEENVAFFSSFYIAGDADDEFLPIPDFHKEIYQLLKKTDRLAIAAPRGFAKSSIVSVFYPMWSALFEKKKDIIIVSATGDLAEKWLGKIKNQLENNQLIMADFGPQKSSKWTQSHIRLKNGCEIQAKGQGYQVRGFRPDLMVCDDLENDELVRSKTQRDKLNNWFWKAAVNTLSKDGQISVIGTILHPMSFLSKLLERRDWVTRKYAAIDEEGESIWPEMYSIDKLEQKRQADPDAFMSEYMNAPKLENAQIVDKDNLNDYDELPSLSDMAIYTTCDPAISKKDVADYSAIVTLGISKRKEDKDNIYVVDSRHGRWSSYETAEQIMTVYKRFRPEKIGIEEVAYQKALREILNKEAEKEGVKHIPAIGMESDYDKVRRAQSVLHILNQDIVHLDKFGDDGDLYEELAVFPSGDYCDLADAFFLNLRLIMDYGGKSVIAKRNNMIKNKGNNPLFANKNLENFLEKKNKNWYSY